MLATEHAADRAGPGLLRKYKSCNGCVRFIRLALVQARACIYALQNEVAH
jgi:hypothetical protein